MTVMMWPFAQNLLAAVERKGVTGLTAVSNNAGLLQTSKTGRGKQRRRHPQLGHESCHFKRMSQTCSNRVSLENLDGRNRAIVIAESLARVIAPIRIASVRWRTYLPPNTIGLHRPCVRCGAIRIARLAFIRLTFVPSGIAEWPARVDRVAR